MNREVSDNNALRIKELEERLADAEQIIDAIRAGEVDAIAVNTNGESEVYTLESGDYTYRILVEEFGEGAVNLSEDGTVLYTNKSFFEMLQLPYEKVVGSQFNDFIHIDSRQYFKKLFTEALTGKSKGEVNLAVHNRVIPVYISFTSLQPKLPTVSIIITDFTEKKCHEEEILKYQRELELKNRELTLSNTELAAFTYIASHDLQEPLRKIQTFSDRILDSDENFAVTTKDYFQRIIAATTRMQNLITSLLKYSRASASEVVFTPTDLNHTLQEIKNNLNERLEETGGVIKVSPLPVLNVIPEQLEQLFNNIISNSIKYRNPTTPLVVQVNAKMATASELNGAANGKNFWRIDVKDNGIGFEPQYASKIFEMFQRLTPGQYEGTGIGLAICKKIVQNHHGTIEAQSEPGKGTTITVYLPFNI